MRVISGSARGRKLFPVPGMDTRPTTDRVKENVFNLIRDWIPGANVLDLFAGTGQLGIEALSRGAAHCDFVERTTRAFTVVRRNVEAARVAERSSLHRAEACAFVGHCAPQTYSLIFLDPPYGGAALENALSAIQRFDILATDGIIVCECAAGDHFAHGFSPWRERRYGATLITVLRRRMDVGL